MSNSGWSKAALAADEGMKVPAGMMSFVSPRRGKPSTNETTLFLGAASFAYAVWENYVEEVAVELTERLSAAIEPERIPAASRVEIEGSASAWELSVHPGWRGLWVRRVVQMTKGGEGGRGGWGLNSATYENAERVFTVAGLTDVLPQRLEVKSGTKAPENVKVAVDGSVDVKNALRQLIDVRGEAVHTARAPEHLRKGHVTWWLKFVNSLYEETDSRARDAVDELLTPSTEVSQ